MEEGRGGGRLTFDREGLIREITVLVFKLLTSSYKTSRNRNIAFLNTTKIE